MMLKRWKKTVFEVIQPAAHPQGASRVFDLVIMTLIFTSVVSVFLATFAVPAVCRQVLRVLEWVAVIVFTVEYLLRIWTADLLFPGEAPWRARLMYMRSGMALIDLAAILPSYLPMVVPVNLVGIRAIRLVRLLRIFKLNRYSKALLAIGEVFRRKAGEMLASMFFVAILLVIASLLIYYAEHDAQPEAFANAFSGMWWAVATLTTVGYGDIYPVTVLGRVLGAVIAILGIGMVALPTGILSSGFMEALAKHRDRRGAGGKPVCPARRRPPLWRPRRGKSFRTGKIGQSGVY